MLIKLTNDETTAIMQTKLNNNDINDILLKARWILTHIPKKLTPAVLLFDLKIAIPDITEKQVTKIIEAQCDVSSKNVLFQRICNALTYDDCFTLLAYIDFEI